MTGHFTFVKGSIADPTGPEFEVKVRASARLLLLLSGNLLSCMHMCHFQAFTSG